MQFSYSNGDSFMDDGNNILGFDLNDIENLLEINNVGDELTATPSTLEAMLNSNLLQEDAPMEVVEPQLPVEVPVEEPEPNSNFLLIKIPEDLQNSPVFDSLPSISLKPNIVREINKASADHDGVYLPLNVKFPEPPKKPLNIIRRKPLQIIQTVVPVVKVSQAIEVAKVNKRKQQFNLTREDGIVFLSDTPEPKAREKRQRKDVNDEWFATLTHRTTAAKPTIDESNRCPGCKKVFKNLANHKCKKLASAEGEPQPEKEPMSCASCNKKYKSKKGLLNHFTKCDQSKVFFDRDENSDTDDAMEDILKEETPKKADESCGYATELQEMEVEVKKEEMMEVDEVQQPGVVETPGKIEIFNDVDAATLAKRPMKKSKKSAKKRSAKTAAKKPEEPSGPAPPQSPRQQKPAIKLSKIEKPQTRFTTKNDKHQTRSAKKNKP